MPSTANPPATADQVAVRSVVPCLTFRDQTEAAVNLYVSVFQNAKIISMTRMEAEGQAIPKGKVLHATFELNGQKYTAFDGGPHFKFTDAFSMVATVETQAELDEVWRRLSEGGKEGPCGWLTDRFGVSWQVLPESLGRMMTDAKSGNPGKAMEALLKMGKLDIAALEKAYKS